jgi:hypothetical protein
MHGFDGDQCVSVVIPDYVCHTEFDLDVTGFGETFGETGRRERPTTARPSSRTRDRFALDESTVTMRVADPS